MSQIKPIKHMPNLDWLEHSKQEIALTGQRLFYETTMTWQIGNVAVVGFIYQSFLSPPWMWFALAKNITIGDLMDFRRLSRAIPPGTQTGIRMGYELGERFAKLYGFEDSGSVAEEAEVEYKIFRRA